jgi:hypothetical protein
MRSGPPVDPNLDVLVLVAVVAIHDPRRSDEVAMRVAALDVFPLADPDGAGGGRDVGEGVVGVDGCLRHLAIPSMGVTRLTAESAPAKPAAKK